MKDHVPSVVVIAFGIALLSFQVYRLEQRVKSLEQCSCLTIQEGNHNYFQLNTVERKDAK